MLRAQTYTIESILGMREKFTDPPYAGFSLFEVCRKKSAAGVQRLAKGKDAWGASKPKTSDEVIRKHVRGTLNKLTPEKYSEIWQELPLDQILEEAGMGITIDMIFAKALQEPGYSKMYAKFCHDIAMHEVNTQTSPPNSDGSPRPKKSIFRNMMVARAQQEFTHIEEFDESLPKEELDELLATQAKRKRANIKFVGQLYMHKVLSSSTMHRIITTLLGGEANEKPKEIDMEVLCELLETIGKTIDMTQDGRDKLDDHFYRLEKLLKMCKGGQLKFGAKTKFKMMDTVELRDNDWIPRVERTGGMTPATLKELEKREGHKPGTLTSTTKTVSSPTTKTPNRRFAPQFPSAPAQTQPETPTSSGPAWRSTPNTPARAPVETPKPAAPKVKFDDRVRAFLSEWVENAGGEALRDWEGPFMEYPEVTEENVFDLVSASAIKEACMTSRANAQANCCKFLVQGIEVGKIPLLTAIGTVLQKAIEEDIPSDVPKFHSRLVSIISTCCGGDTAIDVYRDAIVCTFFAYDQLRHDEDLESVPELLGMWQHLPKDDLDSAVVSTIIASRGGENPANELVVGLLDFIVNQQSLVPASAVEQWLESPAAQSAGDLPAQIKEQVLKQ